MSLVAAADGSSLGNPGPMGWCWYVDESRWGAGGAPSGTNNIGELLAVAELLDASASAGLADEPLTILCDSQYVINSVTKWMPGWKRKGWKKADGKPVLNREILQRIDEAMQGRSVRFEWVKGHAGHPENEAADERARAAAEAYQAGREPNTGPSFSGMEPQGLDAVSQRATSESVAGAELVDAAPEDPVRLLRDLERGLWGEGPQPIRSDAQRDELVHERASGVTADGMLASRAELLASFVQALASDDLLSGVVEVRDVEVVTVTANACIVSSVVEFADGIVHRCSSVWVYERLAQNERSWQLRHHHASCVPQSRGENSA